MKRILFILCFISYIPAHADEDTDRDDYCQAIRLLAFTAHKIDDQRKIDKASGTRDLNSDRILASQLLMYKNSAAALAKAHGAHPETMCDDVSSEDEKLILKVLN